jgi:RND family efflux transporter MFP subunit
MTQHRIAAAAVVGVGLLAAAAPAAAEKIELTTRVSGVVAEVLVKRGDTVTRGAVLLRLDPAILQAKRVEAAAALARAQAEEADAQRDLERAQELYNRTVSSTSELDAATLRHARAQAARAAAQARHTIAQKNLADSELRAPVDAVVSAIPGGPGTVVTADCQPRTLLILDRNGR